MLRKLYLTYSCKRVEFSRKASEMFDGSGLALYKLSGEMGDPITNGNMCGKK